MGSLVESGSLVAALPIALLAGLVSFASPCVLPLVPGYLGYVTGMTDGTSARRGRMLAGVGLFVLGFTVVFLAWFVLIGTVGVFLLQWEWLLSRLAGVVVIVMGVVFLGQVTFLQRTVKPSWQPRAGLVGAPLLGAVFALGWTPCLGPTLVAVSSLAVQDPPRAALLGLAYCLGLGIPFLLVALGLGWVGSSLTWVRRHIRAVNIAGGVVLIVIGVLMVTGIWAVLMSRLGAVISGFETVL
ncbi:cytochrome c-type biogenesis protein [Diaminobutyricimonas aerilata]|uniref:Cytochrome c-type biogenesis protein n=1 Tax=Diaminobutyricimonas aerilata TaxID=1162967 RepID=A0A2M9CG51_9MICO|nr:cytochrome c biogenesis protein CcdA [Diaminobutyricimonas aerilata]PJJ70911.1 cytochrome c-type biogenesis protein [Diaminobutyricimonas aerilata]